MPKKATSRIAMISWVKARFPLTVPWLDLGMESISVRMYPWMKFIPASTPMQMKQA
jgi:hypothetical protein